MNKFSLAVALVFLKFAFSSLTSMPFSFFDPCLALVVIHTFFYSLDSRAFVSYALFCGFVADMSGAGAFGAFTLSYLLTAFLVSVASRIVYRQNWMFIFPLVFASVFLNNHFVLILEPFLVRTAVSYYSGWFLARAVLESIGTTLVAYPIYIFSRRCVPQLIS